MSNHTQCFTMISGTVLRSPCLPLARHLTTPSCDIGRLDLTFNPPPIWQPHPTPSLRGPISFYSRYAKKSCESANSILRSSETACGQIGHTPARAPFKVDIIGDKTYQVQFASPQILLHPLITNQTDFTPAAALTS